MKHFNDEEWEKFKQTFDTDYENPKQPEVTDDLIFIMKLCFCAACILCAIFVLN